MLELCLTSAALGVGLAMDACAVSMANGLNEPSMKTGKSLLIAGMFGFFQALMPMTGWLCTNGERRKNRAQQAKFPSLAKKV